MEKCRYFAGLIVSLAVLFFSSLSLAEVRPASLFSDHAVLQRDAKLPVWGTASPGEKVTVTFCGRSASTLADTDGNWAVMLPPQKPGGPFEMTITGTSTITIKDILVGDVWFCSGQSNMAWVVANSQNAQQEIASATNDRIRQFQTSIASAEQPLKKIQGIWLVCAPNTVGRFSATAYFFAKNLQVEIGVPIGIINSSAGGTRIEAWMSRPALEKIPELKPALNAYDAQCDAYKKAVSEYNEKLKVWQQECENAKAAGTALPEKPAAPRPVLNANSYAALYNGVVAPFVQFPIRGVLWYQGESNAGSGYFYRKLFSGLITDWRSAWKQDFPFLFVQLPNISAPFDGSQESGWAELRESQLMALKIPKTAMAVTIDIGEANNIHPSNKQDVGKRLALAALGTVYYRRIPYSGPIYAGMSSEKGKIRIKFNHVDGGLVAKDSSTLKGFAIAGADRKFVIAQARIENDTVLVWSDEIPSPVAVRYAWANNPICNLYNKAGLPASPFRTDDWPVSTINSR
jgi:sialate O-acetylesterase